MCNIGFQLQQNDAYKFLFAANRDEAYLRPTKSAHFWPDHSNLLAGQDEMKKELGSVSPSKENLLR